MNTKKVGILILSAVVAGVVVSGTNADMFSFNGDNSDRTEMRNNFYGNSGSFGKMGNMNFKKGINGNMKGLTEEEKVALETMTDDEKKDFFEGKREERQSEMETRKADRESHMGVIKKLIDGEELSSDEQATLEDIKAKRAEREVIRTERQGKNEERKEIMDKLIDGGELTDEEISILEEFKPGQGGMGKRGGGKGRGIHR